MDSLIRKNIIKLSLLYFTLTLFAGCVPVRVVQSDHELKEQNYVAALEAIRVEIAHPVERDYAYLTNIRRKGIIALGLYAAFSGLKPGMDEEARRYYQEGLNFARALYNAGLKALLHHDLANYYSSTSRSGLALPFYHKANEYWQKTNHTINIIIGYDSLANVYADLGQLEMKDYNRQRALELAKGYFVLGKQPAESFEWLQYCNILKKRMVDIAKPGSADKVLELWSIMEPIIKKYLEPKFSGYLEVAEYLALAGDIDRAKQLHEQAQEILKKEINHLAQRQHLAQIDLACSDARITFYSGDYNNAVKKMDRCVELKSSFNITLGISLSQTAGLSHEMVGNLDRGIDLYWQGIAISERSRASFSVAERATFFRSLVRRSYWGVIRCLTKKALQTSSDADFLAALKASELVRGRQFGELLDERRGESVTFDSVADFRKMLSSDEIILDYMFMDREIVLFVFTEDKQTAFIVPYEKEDFHNQVVGLVKNLATPTSSLSSLQQQLMLISQKILDPVHDLLIAKKRIVVLPDGILNAVPFELLTLEQTEYRPMIEDKVVLVTPSITYLIRSKKQYRPRITAGLFALADPAYSGDPEIGGLSGSNLRDVAKGNNYLIYFKPLPETRTEVENISSMFKGKPVKKLMGTSASESALKNADLTSYSYLHIATHGILGGDVPGINEPALVLAEETSEDGFLTASEAADLKLDAELAVLSACNTGTGKYFTGEGVMGLSRSFLLAGSNSVLVSLWSVPSLSTEQLMITFYKHLRAGLDVSEAIREAKLEVLRGWEIPMDKKAQDRGINIQKEERIRDNWSHPFYWAAFIPIGA